MILIHALPLSATVNFVRREKKLGRAGRSFWIDIVIVALATLYAFAAHLIELQKDFLAGQHILPCEQKLGIRANHLRWDGGFVGIGAVGEYPEKEEAYQNPIKTALLRC